VGKRRGETAEMGREGFFVSYKRRMTEFWGSKPTIGDYRKDRGGCGIKGGGLTR